MSQPTKPTSEKPQQPSEESALPEAELEKVTGGKVAVSDIKFIKLYDKSSPNLG